MPSNRYLTELYSPKIRTNEQHLMQSVTDEIIEFAGINCYYILRTSEDEVDYIFGEDVLSKFENCYNVTLFPLNINEYTGIPNFNSKFGLEQRASANWILSTTEFSKMVPYELRPRPYEGDLIYSPVHEKLFEIKFVDEDKDFHKLGIPNQRYFDLSTEVIKYSQNKINTGISDIDEVQYDNAKYILYVNMGTGSGNYTINEYVYHGASLDLATFSAKVVGWDADSKLLQLQECNGGFPTISSSLVGNDSSASYIVSSYDNTETRVASDASDNTDLVFEANTIVDITDTNLLG